MHFVSLLYYSCVNGYNRSKDQKRHLTSGFFCTRHTKMTAAAEVRTAISWQELRSKDVKEEASNQLLTKAMLYIPSNFQIITTTSTKDQRKRIRKIPSIYFIYLRVFWKYACNFSNGNCSIIRSLKVRYRYIQLREALAAFTQQDSSRISPTIDSTEKLPQSD